MKKTAHCIHHTHWDLIWYFTVQDATAQFSYNMKEMLRGFRENKIKNFFMDGQSAPIDEYLRLHPEDEAYLKELIGSGKLSIGPFQSQLDCFISNGESVINNLRLGMKSARRLGKVSRIAYLPDSFGHSYDFPKIFNAFDIHDFVITRGVGDNYDLGSEFYMKSNDGSELLVCTMIAGYGYGCYAFKEGTLFQESALDYNKISVKSLMDRLLSYSTLENEFVFPLGFDQNPAMLNISEKIEAYNSQQKDIEFVQTTWEEVMKRVRTKGKGLKTHEYELFSTQYHRLHKSIFSARADIKALQDRCERLLTYELQPLMSMLDAVGIPYDHGLIDHAWDTLMLCQTHSSATLTDETNDYIERETKNALQLALSTKIYLMKLVSISIGECKEHTYPLLVFHTLLQKESMIIETKVLTKTPNFKLYHNDNEIAFSVLSTQKKNCGVLRKDVSLVDETKFYYESDIVFESDTFDGISYSVYTIQEVDQPCMQMVQTYQRFIENERYRIYQDEDGMVIYDKSLHMYHKQAIYLEESGDEGDSFDYSYPTHDLVIEDYLEDAQVSCFHTPQKQWMKVKGRMKIPFDLKERKQGNCETLMPYEFTISLVKERDQIEIKGFIDNQSEAHRVRFVVKGNKENKYSYAGTQYSYIKRETTPPELATWREDAWFEEPSATNPLLNHVSIVNEEVTTSVFTTSSKEYECIKEGKTDLAITLFRSYGAMGYPDLHRRPGRPSGLDYMVFETPNCQMKKRNEFSFAIRYAKEFDVNAICNEYIAYASEPSVYQKQDFDKSLHPIAYFPTNPWHTILPKEYNFLSTKGCVGSFGTIVKSDFSDSYILRLYNNDVQHVKGGVLQGEYAHTQLFVTNMEETKQEVMDAHMPDLKPGELRMVKIMK